MTTGAVASGLTEDGVHTVDYVFVGLASVVGAVWGSAFLVNWVATGAVLLSREHRSAEAFGADNNAMWREAWRQAWRRRGT